MFWERFYQLCKDKGTMPNPLAKDIGISSGSITRWKQGSMPNSETLALLAERLGTTTDYLLGKTDKKNKPTVIDDNYELTSKEEDLIELFRQLSPEQQEIVLRAAGLDPREVDKG